MERTMVFAAVLSAVGAASGATFLSQGATPVLAQQERVCLHDANENAAQRARRQQAIRVARQINTEESRAASAAGGVYQPLESLGAPITLPEGFALGLSSAGKSYAFSLKDKIDACHFVLFSDQDGLIYQAAPLQ